MTREEVVKMIRIIKTNYPAWNPPNLTDLADLWAVIFSEDDGAVIEIGLLNFIKNDTSGFAPSPGQIRKAVKVEEADDTEEAMAMLREAVKKGNYYFAEEYEKLTPSLKKAVGNAENLRAWAAINTDEFETVTLSHVRRAYRNVKLQEKNELALKPLTGQIAQNTQRLLN